MKCIICFPYYPIKVKPVNKTNFITEPKKLNLKREKSDPRLHVVLTKISCVKASKMKPEKINLFLFPDVWVVSYYVSVGSKFNFFLLIITLVARHVNQNFFILFSFCFALKLETAAVKNPFKIIIMRNWPYAVVISIDFIMVFSNIKRL